MQLALTDQARTRMRPRGITAIALELLLEFGRRAHDHRGCRIVGFDRRSRHHVLHSLGVERARRLECHLDAYEAIASDDAMVIVAHRVGKMPP